MGSVLYFIIAILLLCVLVVIHEFGHYIVGRALGFTILEFSVGFGPKLIQWERKGIKYSIRLVPLGGFCAFKGEDEEDNDPHSLNNMPWYKRWLMMFAGPGFNIAFSVLVCIVMLACAGWQVCTITGIEQGTPVSQTAAYVGDTVEAVNGVAIHSSSQFSNMLKECRKDGTAVLTLVDADGNRKEVVTGFYKDFTYSYKIEFSDGDSIKIHSVDKESDFYGKDIESGDVVMAVDGNAVNSISDVSKALSNYDGESDVVLTLLRNGAVFDVSGKLYGTPNYRIGVTVSYAGEPMPLAEAFGSAFTESVELSGQILATLGDLIVGKADISQVSGPVSTITTIGDLVGLSAEYGGDSVFIMILNLIWVLGINIALFNLLPIPALDGARMLFTVIEAIRRKPINHEIEGKIHFAGFAVLILAVIAIEIINGFGGWGTMIWL